MKPIEHPDARDPYVWEPGGVGRYIAALRDAKPGDEIVLRTPFGRGVLLRVEEIDDPISRAEQVELGAQHERRRAEMSRGAAESYAHGALTEETAASQKRQAELNPR